MELIKAKDIMIKDVAVISDGEPLIKAIRLMLEKSVSGLPVVNAQNELIGMVTEHDVMNFAFSGTASEATVADAMTKDVIAFSPEDDIKKIADAFLRKRIRRIPIVEGKKIVGIVSRREILREIARWYS